MKINRPINGFSDVFNIKSHIGRQVLASIPGYLIAFCFGISFNVTAVMLPQLREDKTIYYEASHESWIASVTSLSMVIGSLSSGQITDHYGRKIALIIMGVPYIIGWITIIFAPSIKIIILGRFFTGLASGAVRTVLYVYIGEIVCPKTRAAALVLPSILFNVGTLLSHVLGHYFNWKLCGFICIALAIFVTVSSLFIKESPLWLIAKGNTDEGIELFRWFRGTSNESENELRTILTKKSDSPENSQETIKVLLSGAFIKPMLTLLIVMINVQCSGVNAIESYAQDIFQLTFSGNLDPFIIMSVMDCIVGFVSAMIYFLGKYISKKKLFLMSNFGVALFTSGLVICLLNSFKNVIWVPVTCLVFFLCFSTIVLTIGWTFVPELLPSRARGLGSGVNSALSYILLFAIAKVTPDFMNWYGAPAIFAFFGVSAFICGFILCFILPDTDGKSLQSIEDNYNKRAVNSDQLST